LTGNLIIGEAYPNYKEMFTLTKSVEIPRLDFSDSVKTVMDVLDPEDNNRLTIKVEGNKIILRNDKTEAVHEFERPFEHELDMDVNGLFLESLLRDYKDDVVRIEFGDKNPYIIIKSPNNENQTSLLTMLKRR
jgi:DNA polymerase III sliding clamp (beta) subunit (PCNA family)